MEQAITHYMMDEKLAANVRHMKFVEALRKAIGVGDVVKLGVKHYYRNHPTVVMRVGKVSQNTKHVLVFKNEEKLYTVNWKDVICKEIEIVKIYKMRRTAS